MKNFHQIPYLSLTSVKNQETLCSKGEFTNLKMIVHKSMNIAMNQLYSFCNFCSRCLVASTQFYHYLITKEWLQQLMVLSCISYVYGLSAPMHYDNRLL